jgi:hypothetical protein
VSTSAKALLLLPPPIRAPSALKLLLLAVLRASSNPSKSPWLSSLS